MDLLIPSSKITRQRHPCPNCQTPAPVDVITNIESEDELANFTSLSLNRAQCSSCGALVEAPVRVTVKLDREHLPLHECVPLALLENPEVIDDLLHNTPEGLCRVYSNNGLERSIEAHLRLKLHRRNLTPEEVKAGFST
jgi:hypothetical protein